MDILIMQASGHSQVEIAKRLNCSRCGVQTTLKRYAETGTNVNRPKSGRKRRTSDRDDRELVRLSLSDRKKTSSQLATDLQATTGLEISSPTVRRRLIAAGLRGRKARKKPWLSQQNKAARLKFAKEHEHWTDEDWANVVWSDESNFQIFGTPGVTYVRRQPGEEYDPNCVVATRNHGGGSIMIWGCMSASGVGKIVLCEGRMNAEKYKNTLNNVLFSSINELFGETNMRDVVFQHDNAPCHKSDTVSKCFCDNNIPVLQWPSQSPDLNPIEHLWAILKQKVRRHNPSSKETLLEAIKQEWSQVTDETCLSLVSSMKRRVREVIKRKGGPTKY